MTLILRYISGMLGYMITLFPFYCVGRYLYLRKVGNKSYLYRELTLALFACYIIGIASQTIIPNWDMGIYANTREFYFNIKVGMDLTRVNFIPFRTIYSQLFDGNSVVSAVNLIGNIFLFSPIGIFYPLLWGKFNSFKRILCVGLITTCSIEFLQLFIGRSVDIDDIILNTIGALLGYAIFVFASKSKL